MESLWFDEGLLGVRFRTAGRTITEADLVGFSGISGDFNQVHTNADLMRESQFGQRIAHGALVLSIATGLRSQTGAFDESVIAFAEIRSWRFAAPVFIGDTIHVDNEIVECRRASRGDRGIVVQRVEVRNQDDVVVQEGEMVNLLKARSR